MITLANGLAFQAALLGADTVSDRLAAVVPGLTASEREELIHAGELSLQYGIESDSTISVRLAPAFAEAIRADLNAIDPKIGVEVLFLVAAPHGLDRVDARLLTTLQSFSTMEGIEYYSATRDRMRTLFHESYVVAGPASSERLPDPHVPALPESDQIYVYQRDSSFGRNVLELNYTVTDTAIRLQMRNLTRMNYQGIVPAVGPGDLSLDLVVYPFGEHLLFYGNSGARPLSLLGMEARVQRSFYNRLVALYHWFLDRA